MTLANRFGLIADRCSRLIRSGSNGFLEMNFLNLDGGVIWFGRTANDSRCALFWYIRRFKWALFRFIGVPYLQELHTKGLLPLRSSLDMFRSACFITKQIIHTRDTDPLCVLANSKLEFCSTLHKILYLLTSDAKLRSVDFDLCNYFTKVYLQITNQSPSMSDICELEISNFWTIRFISNYLHLRRDIIKDHQLFGIFGVRSNSTINSVIFYPLRHFQGLCTIKETENKE